MATPSFILANDALARHQKQSIELIYNVTGAKAGAFVQLPPQALLAYDASTTITQAAIDELLGSTNEILASAFGATALGTNAIGIVLNCGGQIAKVHGVEIMALAGSTQSQQVGLVAAMADTLPTIARVEVSALGNLALQAVVTDLDAATAGKLVIKIHCELK